MLKWIEEKGWWILNGNTKGDAEDEFTYTEGRRRTVIDYVLGDEEVRQRVTRL